MLSYINVLFFCYLIVVSLIGKRLEKLIKAGCKRYAKGDIMAKKSTEKHIAEHSHAHSHNEGEMHEHQHTHIKEDSHFHEISAKAMGIALGIFYSASLVILAIAAYLLSWGSPMLRILSSVYPGYDATLQGVFFGLVWGFVDGFISGYIFAWLYNKIGRCKA